MKEPGQESLQLDLGLDRGRQSGELKAEKDVYLTGYHRDYDTYRLLVEHSLDGITIYQDNRIVFANKRIAEILGYSVEELLLLSPHEVEDLIHPLDQPFVKERILSRLAGKERLPRYETRMVRKDKNVRWVELAATHIEFRGKPAIQTSVMDITDRKRAEEALQEVNIALENDMPGLACLDTEAMRDISEHNRVNNALKESEQRYRDLFQNSPYAIFIHDQEGNLLDVNPAACRLHKMEYDTLIQKNLGDLVPSEKREDAYHYLQHLAKVGNGYSEGLSKAADGTEIPVEIRVSRISYDNKPALLFHVHDISDRKKLETQLLHSQKLEAIGRLAGGVAHDFNNLLTVIMGSTEFGLHSCEPNDKIRTELLNIKRAAKQASEFTKQLLAFSRSQIHKPRTIHLNQLIAEHVMMLKHVIGEDIELETDCDQELAPIWGDPVQIQQILMNICVNSRDAMPNGGRLLIKTRNRNGDDPDRHQDAGFTDPIKGPETDFVEITIRDTGVGMDKQTVSQIFEPFFTTKDVGKGTGLGLSLVYGIVRQHHGCIHVESEPAQGTTIKLSFPAATEQEDVLPEEKKTTSSMFGKETILLVEDEEAVLNVGQRILKGFGYDVITAQDGHLAIELLEEKAAQIDLVLLDVVMPKLSGPETFKKLRVLRPNLPVIFVTGYDAKTELNGLEETSDAPFSVLQKPYSKNSLGEIVRELLERRRTDTLMSV